MMPAPTHCSLHALPVGGRKMARSVLAIPLTWILVAISLTSALNPITSSIREESDPGTFVANVKSASNITNDVTPADVNRMRFNLRKVFSFFHLDPITGVLTTTERIDRETQCPGEDECAIPLDIMVMPSDLFAIIKLTVRLEDVNDHSPVFPAPHHSLDISETTSSGALFSLPPAVDYDSGINGVQRYELRYLDRPSTLDKFRLKITNQLDGTIDVRLELKHSLDRELEETYAMQITAIDGGSPPKNGSITVNVVVSDSNDNNPRFLNEPYTGQVYENASNRTLVLQVQAVDPDSGENGHIKYGFAASTLSTYGSDFRIDEDSGQIFVNGDINFESLAMYNLQATATDMGPNRLTAFGRVNIKVLDVNDEAPVISVNPLTNSGREQVLEHANISTFVAYISVSDADSGVNGEFNCAIDNSNFRLEEQEGSDYRLVTNAVFDREVTSEVAVMMSCTDKGNPPLPSTKQINIHIADINDNVPTLSAKNYVVSFKENNSRGDVVVQINATDRDANQNAAIRYEIAPLDDDGFLILGSDVIVEETVRMDPITGLITALKQFDYESKTEYKYLLTVSDHGERPLSSTATMTLSIQDVNDEWPCFQQTAYFMTVSEELPRFTVVGHVSATDDDSSLYNKIIYSIRTSASSDFFRIDLSGEIRTNQELDRERTAEHHVQVIAANQGTPSLNTSVNVTITVLDVNDHAPHLYFPSPTNNTVQMRESIEPGVKVTKVEAVDFDTGDNSLLVYSITRGNEENTFSIDSRTGVIKVANSQLVVNKKTFYLEVTVQDSGEISQVAFQDLNIYVNKSLDAAPSLGGFQGSNLIILISVVCGSILIIVIIVVAVLCVRAHRRHVKKRHNYNCRHQETKKTNGSDTNFDSLNRHSDSSCESVAIAVEGKTVENGHLGTKTKEKSKKEVTFSLDQDDMSSWPPHAQPKPVENPHAHSTEAKTGDPNEDKGQIYSVRGGGVVRKAGGKAGCERDETGANNPHIAQQQQQQPHQQQQLHHHHHHHHHHVCRHHRRMQHGQAMLYGGERSLHHLTQGDLEMHDMLNSSVDHESECSCSGSITDSGRGPSEEGDNGLYAYPPPVGDPYYGTEPRGGCCADIPIVDTIIEETELSGDSETGGSTNLSDCPDGSNNHLQLPQPHGGHPLRSGNLGCSPSRTSVDSQASSRCGHRLRHPLKYSNENVHTRCCTPGCGGLSRCPGCRSPIRSSLESVNSAPGRMDMIASTSYLKPKRSPSDCSDGSLVSGIVALAGSDEGLHKSASKDSLNNGRHSAQRSAHCLHSLEDLNSDVRPVSSSRQVCCNPTAHVGRVGNCSTNPTHQYYNSNPRNQRQPQHPYGYTNRKHPYGYMTPSQATRQGPGSYHREPAMFEHGADTLAVMPSLQTLPLECSDPMPGQPKGVRFAEPQIERAFPTEDTYNHGCYTPDCLSDDGTTTSGSYSLDSVDSNRRQRTQAIHLPGPEEGTCV